MRAEQLPDDLGSFPVITFAQSFHGENLGMRDRAINGLKALAVKLRPSSVLEYTPDDISQLLESGGFSVIDHAT